MSYRVPNKCRDCYYIIVSENWKLLRAYRNYNYANEWRNNNLKGRGYIIYFTKRNYSPLFSPLFSIKHKIKYDKSDCFIFNTNEEEIKNSFDSDYLDYTKSLEYGYWKFNSRIKQLHPNEEYPVDNCILNYRKENIVGTDSVFLFQFSVDEEGIPFYTITEYPAILRSEKEAIKDMPRELFNFLTQKC